MTIREESLATFVRLHQCLPLKLLGCCGTMLTSATVRMSFPEERGPTPWLLRPRSPLPPVWQVLVTGWREWRRGEEAGRRRTLDWQPTIQRENRDGKIDICSEYYCSIGCILYRSLPHATHCECCKCGTKL